MFKRLALLLLLPLSANAATVCGPGMKVCYDVCNGDIVMDYCEYKTQACMTYNCCAAPETSPAPGLSCVGSYRLITCTLTEAANVTYLGLFVDNVNVGYLMHVGTYSRATSTENESHTFRLEQSTASTCDNYPTTGVTSTATVTYQSAPLVANLISVTPQYDVSNAATAYVQWGGSPGPWDVYRRVTGTGAGAWVKMINGTGNLFAGIPGSTATSYDYYVVARNSFNGFAAPSNNITAMMPYPQPTLALASTGYRSIQWSWIAPSPLPAGGVTYKTYITGVGNSAFLTGTSYTYNTASGLATPADNTQYCAVVKTADAANANLGRDSNVYCGTTAPGIPNGATTVVALPALKQVRLTWTNMPGATSYEVYRDGALKAPSVTPGTGTTTYLDSASLTDGTTYSYTLVAKSTSGSSPQSTGISATTLAATGGPPTLTGGNAQINVTWSYAAGSTSYDIARARIDTGVVAVTFLTNVLQPGGSPSTVSYLDTGLVEGAQYRYAYTPKVGTTSGTQSGYTDAYTAPATVTGLAATPGQYKNTVTFTTPASVSGVGPAGYAILYSADNTTWATAMTVGPQVASSVVNQDVSVATGCYLMYWKVAPVAASTAGTAGVTRDVSALASVSARTTPSAPVSLAVTNGAANSVLSWGTPADAWCSTGQKYNRSDNEATPTTYTQTQIGMGASPFTNDGVNTGPTIGSTAAGNGSFHSYVIYYTSASGDGPVSNPASNTPATPNIMRMRVGQ
jgi:hypothetical protein